MWRAYNCKATGIYYPDSEVSHVLHQLMNNSVVNKSANASLTILSTILKSISGLTSIAAYVQRHLLRRDDTVLEQTNTFLEWFVIIIQMADLSFEVIINLNRRIKAINPNSSFVDALLNLKFEGDFKSFEKKCDAILSDEQLAIGSVNQAALYCLIGNTIDNYFNKQIAEAKEVVVSASSKNNFAQAESALKVIKPFFDMSGRISYDKLIRDTTDSEYIQTGQEITLREGAPRHLVSDKMLQQVKHFEKKQLQEQRAKNDTIIRNITQRLSTKDIPPDEIELLLRKGVVDFVKLRIDRDIQRRMKDSTFLDYVEEKYQIAANELDKKIDKKKHDLQTERESPGSAPHVIARLQRELNELKNERALLKKSIEDKNKKYLIESIEDEHNNRIKDPMGHPYSYSQLYDRLYNEFINAGGDWNLLINDELTMDTKKARKIFFEKELFANERLYQMRIMKEAGFIVSKHLYKIIKYTIGILPKRLLVLMYDNRVVSSFFDEVLGFIAGIILGADYLAKDEKLTSMSDVIKQYISTELASEDPFISSVFEDSRLVLDEKYKEKKEQDLFNIFTADKNFEELEYIHNKELLAEIIKKKVEKAEAKRKPRGVAFISGGALPGTEGDELVDKVVSDAAEKIIGKNIRQIRRIAETSKPEIKKEVLPTLSGMYSNIIAKKVEEEYKDPWHTPIGKPIKDKIHRLLCYLSAKSQYISIHYTSTVNIILALLYFQSKFADTANKMYQNYKKNIRPGAKFDSFCEWVQVSSRSI